jgi:uncharacterized protein with HEPN domain
MSRDDGVLLRHRLDYARKLNALARSRTREDYDRDETLQAACRYWLQVIGEAARGLTPEFEQEHPDIPWRAMIGMRNRIVHDYLGIDDETVWKTVSERIPELTSALEALIPD